MRKKPMVLIDPEKIVEMEILAWCFCNGFAMDVYDSEVVVFNGKKMRNPGVKVGTPDLIGTSGEGYSVFLELKAPGKEKVCSIEQHSFLLRKLEKNAFGLVVSCSNVLQATWSNWLNLRKEGKEKEAREYLITLLPKKVLVNGRVIELVA